MTDPSFGQQQPAPAGDYEVTLPPVAQLPETPGYATLVEPAALAERPKRSKKKLVLLSLLIVLLLGAAGAFTTLWMIERNDRQATAHELDVKRKALTESENYGKTVQGQLDRSRSEQYDLQSELKELRQEKAAADAERAKGTGSKCEQAGKRVAQLVPQGNQQNQQEATKAIVDLYYACK